MRLIHTITICAVFSIIISVHVACQSSRMQRQRYIVAESEPESEPDESYKGPRFKIGLTTFANETNPGILGIGESVTIKLRKLISLAGLDPVLLSIEEKKHIDKTIKIYQFYSTNAVIEGIEGLLIADFIISGSVKEYSEIYIAKENIYNKNETIKMTVSIDMTLIDILTGKTLIRELINGEYLEDKTEEISLYATVRSERIERAVGNAVSKFFKLIVIKLQEIPFRSIIQSTDGENIVFRDGANSKLEPGTRLEVYRILTQTVKSDKSVEIRKEIKTIGEVIVTSYRNKKTLEARVVSGDGFQRGDIVRFLRQNNTTDK